MLILEDTTCDGCQQPLTESLDPDREGWYMVEPVICAGCRARETYRGKGDAEPGERLRVSLDPNYVKRS